MPLFPTSLENIIFGAACLLWMLTEAIGGGIIPWLRRGGGDIKKKDSGSSLLIRVLVYVSVFIAILLAIRNIAMLPNWFFYPGIVLMVIGIFVRQWSMFILGRFFTLTVSVQKNQKVVDYGPYRYIRHPSYLGLFMIMIGIGTMYLGRDPRNISNVRLSLRIPHTYRGKGPSLGTRRRLRPVHEEDEETYTRCILIPF
jgi:hypothetical protein